MVKLAYSNKNAMHDKTNKTGEIAEKIISGIKKGKRYTYKAKGKHDTKKPPEAVVFLVMKNNEEDIGIRPLENPTYSPPCIWTEEFVEGGGEGDRVNEIKEGYQYQITAEVHNLGLLPSFSTFVEFYWRDTTPSEPFLERLHLIGIPKMVTVNAGSSNIVRSDLWVPEYVHDGHECIIVRAYDPILDPVASDHYSQVVDRHVGQRNINVIIAAQGTNAFLMLNIWSANKEGEKILLTANRMNECELTQILKHNKIKANLEKTPPVYFGMITSNSLANIHWNIKGFDIKERTTAFHTPKDLKKKPIQPLSLDIDSRFNRAILPRVEMMVKNSTDRIWSVIGIPHNASKGGIYGITITQWQGLEIIGKVHHLAIVD